MSNRILIPRTDIELGGAHFPSPAWFLDEDGFILMRCNCGDLCGLGKHTIEPNGDVRPSIYHAEADGGCGWHVYATLADWQDAELTLHFAPMPKIAPVDKAGSNRKQDS